MFLKAAGVMLLLAVPPIWPYGYYMLLRLVVCGVAFYTAFHLKESNPRYFVVLIIAGLLFNPLLPIALPKPLWSPIDLGGAFLFFRLARRTSAWVKRSFFRRWRRYAPREMWGC